MAKKVKRQKEKVYKKGTKIKLQSSCSYAGCNEEEVIILDEDQTESQLNSMAHEYAIDCVQPEGSFEVADED